MSRLYELTGQYLALQDLAESGDMSADDLADTFDAIEGEYQDKAVAVIQVAQNFDATVTAIDSEIDRLNKLKAAAKGQQDRLREYLRENMERTGIKKIEHPLFKIALADGRDMVDIIDADKLPNEYISVKVTESPNKKVILEQLKDGVEIPGAALTKSKTSLRIK